MKYFIAPTLALVSASIFQSGSAFSAITAFTRTSQSCSLSQCNSITQSCTEHMTRSQAFVMNTRPSIGRHRKKSSLCTLKSALAEENELSTSDSSESFSSRILANLDALLATEKPPEELAFNFLLLSAAFGFAFYTMLNIDHGMTRGWTQTEILARIPFDNWRQYEDSLAEKPIFTKTTINVIIYLLGDWLSQTIFQKKEILDFDASRTLKNGFIGLCFGPLVHQYYEFSDAILPPAIAVNRIYKIFMDQTIYLGVKCSVYIAAVGLLGGQSVDEVKESVQTRIKPIMVTAWKFWPLVHCVTYGLIPARHRILWVNSVDLIWNAILAQAVRNEEEEEDTIDVKLEESIEMAQISLAQVERVEDEESEKQLSTTLDNVRTNEVLFQNSTFPTRNNSLISLG